MPDWSRRRALHALATSTTAVLAGCSGERSHSRQSVRGRGRTPITDYTALKVRDPDGDPIFWSGEEPDDPQQARRGRVYVTSSEEISELTFAPESEDAATLNAFVTSTDYEQRSVSLHSTVIPECNTLRLQSVAREPDGYHTSFCSEPRPADVECDADRKDTVAIAIRLPFPGDDLGSSGSRWSSRCRERPYPVTPANETEVAEDA